MIATFAAALAAFFGLWATICLANRDRSDGQRRLSEEREQHKKDLLRQDRIRQLEGVSEQYTHYQASTTQGREAEQQAAELRLQALLWLLPDGQAKMLKYQFGVSQDGTEVQQLIDRFGTAGQLEQRFAFPQDLVFQQLRSDTEWAIAGGDPHASPAG